MFSIHLKKVEAIIFSEILHYNNIHMHLVKNKDLCLQRTKQRLISPHFEEQTIELQTCVSLAHGHI